VRARGKRREMQNKDHEIRISGRLVERISLRKKQKYGENSSGKQFDC